MLLRSRALSALRRSIAPSIVEEKWLVVVVGIEIVFLGRGREIWSKCKGSGGMIYGGCEGVVVRSALSPPELVS